MEDTIFKIHIINGYAFKNLLAIINGETKQATLLLTPDNIEISFINDNSGGLHIININPHENLEWFYNPRDDENKLLNSYPIGFVAKEALGTLKNIGTNDAFRLILLRGENDVLVQPLSSTEKAVGQIKFLKFGIKELDYQRYEVNKYKTEPNIKIYSKAFANLCSEANNVKCEYIDIESDGKIIKFTGYNASKKDVFYNCYDDLIYWKNSSENSRPIADNISDIDTLISKMNISNNQGVGSQGLRLKIVSDDVLVRVPISTFKSLSKINNISPKGTILRFYIEKNSPIKIETIIGIPGTYQIYLK